MKRSIAGLVLLIIGVVFLVLAPLFAWVIGPTFVKIPDNIDSPSVYEGTLKLFVDPSSLSLLGEEMAVVVPLKITRVDKSLPEQYTSSVAVIEETQDARGPANKQFVSADTLFALDRRNCKNVPGNGSSEDRTGYSILLPFNTQKTEYDIWDDETGHAGPIKFVKESTRDGFKNKNVKVYMFAGEGTEPMVVPPLGLPDKLSGAQIKTIASGMPNAPTLNLNDTEMYKITYLKENKATVAIEPRTGTFNDVVQTYTYSVDASAMGLPDIKLATVSFAQTPESVAWNIDNNAKNFTLLDLVHLWIPLILLIIGIVLFVPGLILFLRKKAA